MKTFVELIVAGFVAVVIGNASISVFAGFATGLTMLALFRIVRC